MDIIAYLKRINYTGDIRPSKEVLFSLHQLHLLTVPFENLNIHYNLPISLNIPDLFQKIVRERRGGFCYELNGLFNWLLKEIGFKTQLIAARVFDENGNPGPEFDHAALIVHLDKRWLIDVGFGGDSFIFPKELTPHKSQEDVHEYFQFRSVDEENWCLLHSADGNFFSKKYIFNFLPHEISDFRQECDRKQKYPESHFVNNLICTKAIPEGRISIFNDQLSEKKNGNKEKCTIQDEKHLFCLLGQKFGITEPENIKK